MSGGWSVRAITLAKATIAAVTLAAAPAFDLAALVDRADLVVVGRIVSVTDGGAAAPGVLRGAIEVDAIVKGPQIGLAKFTTRQRGIEPTPADACAIFFLAREGEEYGFLDTKMSSVAAACGTEPTSVEPLDRAIDAIGSAARSRALPVDARLNAMAALAATGRPRAVASLRPLLRDQERQVQISAAAALMRLGDAAPLPLAEGLLLGAGAAPAPGSDAAVLLGAMSSVREPRAVGSLARLLGSSVPAVRAAAAAALGHTRSEPAIAPLARALDDGDVDVRYAVVVAFSELAGETPIDAAAFRADPERYMSRWREWAAARAR